MSSTTAHTRDTKAGGSPPPREHAGAGASRRRAPRRRLAALVVAAALGIGTAAVVAGLGPVEEAVREITLPLRHEDIIRQQAAEKGLDPALIAAVIYEESKFRDQTSHAGAKGLMQITPATAEYIARKSGGTQFQQGDLATPQINISYGAYYLRYLLQRYDQDEELALAAYNAGETNLDRWVRRAGGPEEFDSVRDVPFPETRDYVRDVLEQRSKYREAYGSELGYEL